MNQRISAGGIVFKGDSLLLVHHQQKGDFDFWVMPGGGVEGAEGIYRAAEREVYEETGINVQPKNIAYIEEFIDGNSYVCKFWVYCEYVDGEVHLENRDPDEAFLTEAGFFSKAQVKEMRVFPDIVSKGLWEEKKKGFSCTRYLGFQEYN